MIASNRFSPSAKRNKIGRLLGFCSVCGTIPEYFMIYNCGDGVQKLERYCGPCLEKEKAKKVLDLLTKLSMDLTLIAFCFALHCSVHIRRK